MFTYMVFTRQILPFMYVGGMPLLFAVIAMVLKHQFKIDTSFLVLFVPMVVADVLIGIIYLVARSGRLRSLAAGLLSTVVISVSGVVMFHQQVVDELNLTAHYSQWGKPKVIGAHAASKLRQHNDIFPELEKGEVYLAYGVSDVTKAKRLIAKDDDVTVEPVSYLGALMTPLDGLEVTVEDNEFRVTGFEDDLDGFYVIVEGHANYIGKKGSRMEDPYLRVFVHKLVDLSSEDHKLGYVDLPLNYKTQMTERAVERIVRWRDSKKVHMQYVDEAI
ncbi:hypothetical protein EDC38_3140 [Marinimicrobium koreense]|uniref:Uncharacterized protein n=1 Tax=Marinimicrobium koreense TaxID=306545 RepID=A0A3N1NZS5_9GAMM|nr:hypothetical protein [Marinimicrobium koreense]ROQ18166.1 hypothetical protein EDC38_3140 [Marinimicrobium koreense]